MAVKIRLRRIGAKKQPAYRLVIADARAPRDGRFIEIVGHYNPLTEVATVVINRERVLYWLRQGAQPTDVVKKMLNKQGIWTEFTTGVAPVIEPEPVVEAPVAPVVEPVVEEAPAAVEEAPVTETEEPIAE